MKKMLTLLIAAWGLLYCTSIKGQTALGIKAGVNISQMTENDASKARVSGHGGVFLHRTINKYFCVQPELLLSSEGQKYMYNGAEHTWSLNVIQLPVMFQVYPIREVYIEAGPQVGLLISARDKITNGGHANVKTNFATAQFAVGVGAGVKATDHLIVYGRYNFGLTDLTSYDPIVNRFNVGQFGLAYRFHE